MKRDYAVCNSLRAVFVGVLFTIPCDEQLCSLPTLSEQESSQARQMDRGEIEVGEERRVRMKCVPVLPTDKRER